MKCIRCGRQTRYWASAHVPGHMVIAGHTCISGRGAIFIGDAASPIAVYCAACAPAVQICRTCGCTDEVSCSDESNPNGRCSWVAPGLCSSCWWLQQAIAAALAPGQAMRRSALAGLVIPGCDRTRYYDRVGT